MKTEYGKADELGLSPISGATNSVMGFPASTQDQSFLVTPGAGEETIVNFSLLFDIYIPKDTSGNYGGLFQSNLANGDDADFFIKKNANDTAGIGIDSKYDGALSLGQWHRIGLTVKDNQDGTSSLMKFIDGVKVGEQDVDSSRYSIVRDSGFLILTDDSQETFNGYLSSFLFVDRPLTDMEIGVLGAADSKGILNSPLTAGNALEFSFDGDALTPTIGTGTLAPQNITPAIGSEETLNVDVVPDNMEVLVFPAGTPDGGFHIKPAAAADMSSYSLVFDLYVASDSVAKSFGGLFQTSLANNNDADTFMKFNGTTTFGLGISGDYAGAGKTDTWHRIGVTVEKQEDGKSLLTTYIDGEKVNDASVDTDRFTIDGDDGFLILTDNDGESNPGYLNSFLVSEKVFSEQEMKDLGGVKSDGIKVLPSEGVNETQFDFNGKTLDATFGNGTMTDRTAINEPVEAVKIVKPIKDMMVTPDADNVVIDLTTVFEGENLTYSVTTSNGEVVEIVPSSEPGKLIIDFDKLGYSDIKVTAKDGDGHEVTDWFRARVAGPNAYTMAVLPDTQDYTSNSSINSTFGNMTQWLADNAADKNLAFVMHVGDVTQNNTPSQWQIAKDAYDKLDGVVPYSVLAGNHDQGPGGSASDFTSRITDYFPVEKFSKENGGTLGGVYKGEMANNYHTFEAPDGTKWLILSLEFGTRDDVIDWAGSVIEDHLDHRVILNKHFYMNFNDRGNPLSGPLFAEGTGHNYGIVNSPEGASDGEEVWRDLVSKYPNVSFTFSGHVFGDGAETLVSYSDYGTPVHQMVVNYQGGVAGEIVSNGVDGRGTNGGNGAIRLITIDPDNNRVSTETYFVEHDEYLNSSRGKEDYDRNGLTGKYREHEETIENVDMGPPKLFAKAKAGDDQFVEAGAGKDTGLVSLDASGSIDPGSEIVKFEWLDDEGNVVATGKKVDVELPGGRHDLVLRTTDANNMTNEDDIRIIVSTDNTLLVDNFNDGNFDGWQDQNQVSETPIADQLVINTPAALGIADIPGGNAVVVGFPRSTENQGYGISVDFKPENGPVFKEYSMVFDIMFPTQEGTYGAFFQTNMSNTDDGEAFFKVGAGIGISGQYDGSFNFDTWHRVAFTFTDNGTDLTLRKFIDGVKVGEQNVSSDRFSIDPEKGFLILTDENGEVFNGYLNSFLFTAEALSEQKIADLGGVDADGILTAEEAGDRAIQFDYDTGFNPTFGTGSASVVDLTTDDSRATWNVKGSVAGRSPDNSDLPAVEGALYEYSNGNAVLVYNKEGSLTWSDYAAEVTVLSQDDDMLGVAVYYKDKNNHYKVTLNTETNERKLIKVKEGVETLLASSTQGYPFNDEMELKVAVVGGVIYASLDGQVLFDGPVKDVNDPLIGGTVALLSSGQYQSIFDDVVVTKATVTAHAGEDQNIIDFDGDHKASVTLDAENSFSVKDIVSYVWKDGDTVLGSSKELTVDLKTGAHQITLIVKDADGKMHEDLVNVNVFNKDQILMKDDFEDGDVSAWKIVDEGEKGDAAQWSEADGSLTQSANTYSRELAKDSEDGGVWKKYWSPHGDGWHVLRKGTYALYNKPEAANWSDYTVETEFSAVDAGGVGILFHYKDAKNYYKLELDSEDRFAQLTVLVDGIEKSLMLTRNTFSLNENHVVRIDVQNNQIQAYFDGMALFAEPIEDRSHLTGTVGLYSWGTEGVSFKDVTVRELEAKTSEDPVVVIPDEATQGDDTLTGTADDDALNGKGGNDDIDGKEGDDILLGGNGSDDIKGNDGDDAISGGNGSDNLNGGDGDDALKGGNGSDNLNGGASGDDVLKGGNGSDNLNGGAGDDELKGGNGSDRLDGGTGDDVLKGGNGSDELLGGAGDDYLHGGNGSDLLNGGEGDDILKGGNGADNFVFTAGADIIRDFKPGIDTITLDGFDATEAQAAINNATEADGNLVITLDADEGDILTLKNTDKADLDDGDFVILM